MQTGFPKQAKRSGTRDRLLGTAERLFAEYGYDGVSIRQIGAAADAQIALINYHFGTKDMLYRAVLENRIRPVSERRRALLREVLGEGGRATIEAVLDALARPGRELRGPEAGRHNPGRRAREVNDPREAERGIVGDLLDPLAFEFLAAMEQVLPGRSRSDVHWAYHAFISTLLLALANPERVKRLSGDLVGDRSDEVMMQRLVRFVARSLRSTDP